MNPDEYGIMRQQEETHWWYHTLRAAVLRHLLASLGEGASPRILDAGCGTGGMLSELRASLPRAELTGLDADPQAVSITAARQVANRVIRGSGNALPFRSGRFDAVLSRDVLCHASIVEAAAFGELARVVRPGGLLLLNLPAFEALRGAHDVAVHTARRYTPRRMAQLAAANDLAVERWTCWNMILLPPFWAWRLAGRLTGSEASDLRPFPAWVNAGLSRLLRLEWRVADRVTLPVGSSLFAILRRSSEAAPLATVQAPPAVPMR